MSSSGKDNGADEGEDRGDFYQLKAKVMWMILGWGVTAVVRERFQVYNLGTILRKVGRCF
jgi:hypothetical protein